ncbi:putative protein in bacteria [Phaeobacter piscinae]|uniref:Twin-arginine translocation pathway signal n=1 Tax=Phaeobacter piscinae TaxID=1580596 RepID=A0AAN1GPF2_9RHOB|nr:DUF1513 domain-containing protein [Phaeobacter piscinae]ATG42711.1 putative protein in bacteria [Phaeobacter piscinae]AUR35029.1 putative protein in bacteria [Phaeobacter piscinae]
MAGPSRRGFLAGLLAAGMAPQASWADIGDPAYLAAGKSPDGRFLLAGLDHAGGILFRHPLPARGHAAAAHPTRPEAVAFARRPGQFADVIDCRTGAALARLTPPTGHHFYGHGVFSPDGRSLFTTENAFESGDGRIGIWDASDGYRRIGDHASGGIGPHDIRLRTRPDGQHDLVVANGGIQTHPDSGRAKLNLATMQPNLCYLSLEGTLRDQLILDADLRLNSIRHLTIHTDGTVGFAMQWQGDLGADLPIIGLQRPGERARLMAEDDPRLRNLNGYGGSVAFSRDGTQIAVTSPRGGVVQIADCTTGALLRERRLADVCGLASNADGFVVTTGQGLLAQLSTSQADHPPHIRARTDLAWDNHLIPIA